MTYSTRLSQIGNADIMDIGKTSSEELASLVEQYPWFAAARVELCRRTACKDSSQYMELAAYVGDLSLMYGHMGQAGGSETPVGNVSTVIKAAPRKQVRVAGGDFFSQDEYNGVKEDGDYMLASIARATRGEGIPQRDAQPDSAVDFCTEALAEIYAGQGHPEQARYIYSQLILRYPEKSAYFAVLIDKLNKTEKDTL